ncbi:protein BCAP-like [Mytilus edulis]|uniref:protein BCAP-like n=1 Tax=Mytilus edulis TaxID=6550 RepID=UPI0039EF7107
MSSIIKVVIILCVVEWYFAHETTHEEINLPQVSNELENLKLEMRSMQKYMTEVFRKNELIQLENDKLKKENKVLQNQIGSLETKTIKIERTMNQMKTTFEWTRHLITEKEAAETVNQDKVSRIETLGGINTIQEKSPRLIVPAASQGYPVVGFNAVLTHDVSLGPHQTLVFDTVITNVGQAYEPRDGQFSAPYSGLYLV